MKIKILLSMMLIASGIHYNSYGQSNNPKDLIINIDSILANPGVFNNEFVKIKGQVIQYSPGDSQTTASYSVQGEYGGKIIVTTMDTKPEVFQLYEVAGTVVIDPYTQDPYIIERSKSVSERSSSSIANPLLLFGMFIGTLAIAVFFVVYYVKSTIKQNIGSQKANASQSSGGGFNNDFKTIRLSINNPKSLKFIPGKLVITSGDDRGKELMIAGYPTSKGNVVSIGRESVSGDKAYSHIQLTETTVSRKQAELIQVDGRILIKNLSETNYTQLNGRELKPEQEIEVTPNSIIKMGSLELKYVI